MLHVNLARDLAAKFGKPSVSMSRSCGKRHRGYFSGTAPEKEAKSVRRYFAGVIVLMGVSLGASLCSNALKSVSAQGNQNPNQNSSAQPVMPNEGAVIGGPGANTPTAPPTLQCQGCHAPGKALPYLAGSPSVILPTISESKTRSRSSHALGTLRRRSTGP